MMCKNFQGKKKIESRKPGTIAVLLIFGGLTGVFGSMFGWFAPVHELGHVIGAVLMGGSTSNFRWASVVINLPPGGRLRFAIAMGAVFEYLVAVVLMIWALLRARPFLSALGWGYAMHGMDWATGLIEWSELTPAFLSMWRLATALVYILGFGATVAYIAWIRYADECQSVARARRRAYDGPISSFDH
jgi:hypothetical protein